MKSNRTVLKCLLFLLCGALVTPSVWGQEQGSLRLNQDLQQLDQATRDNGIGNLDDSSISQPIGGTLPLEPSPLRNRYAINLSTDEGADFGGFKVTAPTGEPGSWTTFEALKDASLTFNVAVSTDGSTGLPSSEPVTVGIYTYSKEGDVITVKDSKVFSELQATERIGGLDSPEGLTINYGDIINTGERGLEISAGDMVGMWVQRGVGPGSVVFLTEGAEYFSDISPDDLSSTQGYYQTTLLVGGVSGARGAAYFNFGEWDTPNVGSELIISMVGAAPASSGAPLPGVVATVMLCGAVGGYFNRRKKTIDIE